jgi:hypothetical protein
MRSEAKHQQDEGGGAASSRPDRASPESGPELPAPKNPFIPGPLISEPDEAFKVTVPVPPKADQ